MSRQITPKDCHALMNLLVKQATGQQSITVTDTSSFVSAGELVMLTGMENVINSLNIVLGRTIVASRPYKAKLGLMEAIDTGAYTNRLRKISFYSKDALADGSHNTDLFTNLKDGYTAGQNLDSSSVPQSTKSQWEQHAPVCLEMNFAGSSVWQDCITMYEDQLKVAFRNEAEFASFVSGYITEHGNDIESQKEAWRRMNMLNKIAGVYDMSAVMPKSVVNLTAEFNSYFGTSYTSAQLRSTYLKEFLAFMTSTIKEEMEHLTIRSVNRHWSPAKVVDGTAYSLLRHTPYDKQRLYLYSPLFRKAEALVLPEIFRPEYLNMDKQYEGVEFWQTEDAGAEINVTPAIVDTVTGTQKAGDPVNLKFVVGVLTDVDALMTNMQLDATATTPLEARKRYRNTWQTFMKNNINDFTENTVIFIMAD